MFFFLSFSLSLSYPVVLTRKACAGGEGGWEGKEEKEQKLKRSEGQGCVVVPLGGDVLLRHHVDQRLHGSAKVVSHVEQTADTRA